MRGSGITTQRRTRPLLHLHGHYCAISFARSLSLFNQLARAEESEPLRIDLTLCISDRSLARIGILASN